jgi:hypothetical protein
MENQMVSKGQHFKGGTRILPIWVMSVNQNLDNGKLITATVIDKLDSV